MSRGPYRFKQSDVRRALKAAVQAGAPVALEILLDGTIRLVPVLPTGRAPQETGSFVERPPLVF